MGVTSGEPGWRDVLSIAGAVVVGVLALQVLSGFVPSLGELLGGSPIVVVVLIAGTAVLVVAALRRSRQPR